MAPSFVYLSFNRYGAPNLPRVVKAEELDSILQFVHDADVISLVQKWYKKDENAVPAEYILMPISSGMPEFLKVESKS